MIRLRRSARAILVFATVAAAGADLFAGTWTPIGPEGAIVNAIVIDPTNPAIAYAATQGGGIFQTEDGGANWSRTALLISPSTPSTPNPIWNVQALAIDPTNPAMLWAGAGSYLFRSSDGGSTWAYVWSSPNASSGGSIWSITVDPGSPTRVYVGKEFRVVRTSDGGASWQNVYSVPLQANFPQVMSIAVDPSNRDALYVGVRGWSASKSTNGGANWTTLPISADVFVIDPGQPQTVYAGRYGSGVRKSIDGGTSWAVLGEGVVDPYVRAVVLDPTSPATVYAGTESDGLFKSVDGGATWTPARNGLTNPYVRSLGVVPGKILAGMLGAGIFESSDGAASWSERNSGLLATRVQRLASSGGTVLAGIYGVNLFRRSFTGGGWTPGATPPVSPVFLDLTVAPSQPTLIYVATPYGLMRSTNRGDTWTAKTPPGTSRCQAIRVHPTIPTVAYASCFSDRWRLIKTSDGGDLWTAADSGLVVVPENPINPVSVAGLAIDPASPDVLYAATNLGIFKSVDAGTSWVRIGEGASTGVCCITGQMADVTIDPSASQTLYAIAGGGFDFIWRSTDGGQTWTDLVEASVIAVDPRSSAIVYAGSGRRRGVRKSVDGGATWSVIGSELENRPVTSLLLDPSNPSRIFAGIDAGGVFVLDQKPPITGFCAFLPCGSPDP
jgi:photosystem II stability/assembly factor-like uncharacterized protein